MKNETLDYINIWLLIVSFVIAIYLPFELFLFSYAVLGPLHYLTEMNWLKDRKYFISPSLKTHNAFIIFSIVIAIYPLMTYLGFIDGIKDAIYFFVSKKHIILISGFMFSVSVILFNKVKYVVWAFVFCIFCTILCSIYVPTIMVVLGVFLPTLIHVYIFTLFFMIYGQLKSKSKSGIISICILIIVPFLIVILDIKPSAYSISDFVEQTYLRGGLLTLNQTLGSLLGNVNNNSLQVFSSVELKIQIFIAFAYTYHYLNWFSKTSIIGWKSSVNSVRMKYILCLWLCSVSVYFYDYILGLTILFFLSLLHVVLEFPLNVITIKELILTGFRRFQK